MIAESLTRAKSYRLHAAASLSIRLRPASQYIHSGDMSARDTNVNLSLNKHVNAAPTNTDGYAAAHLIM